MVSCSILGISTAHWNAIVMILIGQYDSPFVRRIAIALNHYGMPFERRVLSVFQDFDAVLAIASFAESRRGTLVVNG